MLNNYVWNLYLSSGGQKVVDMFEKNLIDGISADYAKEIKKFQKVYCPCKGILDETFERLDSLYKDVSEQIDDESECAEEDICEEENDEEISDVDLAEELFDDYYEDLYNDFSDDKESFMFFSWSLPYETTDLASIFPNFFVPYFFKMNFNVFEKICNEFGIKIPPVPFKKNYKERIYYYFELCKSLYEFRIDYNLSPFELCAFLYDFAPKYIGGTESYIIRDLPAPQSAFLIGSSPKDIFYNQKITPWQCSPETQAGDIIVMYMKSPVSAINSVWRSVSVGFNDPFFYYYRCTYISERKLINKVSLEELKSDDIFKNIPIVKKNMQGVNGTELLPSHFNHLMDISKSDIQRFKVEKIGADKEFLREKDVENKLIKPLLKKLKYDEKDYVQQLYIDVGNHNYVLIPDFVLLPVNVKNYQSAFAVIEAKLYIPNKKTLEYVKSQARSYARQLNAEYAVIIDKNKVFLFSKKDDFTEYIFNSSWTELENIDVFSKLFKIIGNNK